MRARCRLCGREMSATEPHVTCHCGWVLDSRCAMAHAAWCPRGRGGDAWIGAVEL